MKWDMEIEEIEAILEKIWDLHDKLSDAIHSISRTHFLNSIKALNKSSDKKKLHSDSGDENRAGFVFVKELRLDSDDSVIQEAKSLNAIRTALENLEDQLEFFHTIQIQQRAERDAAIARLEQSRIVLAMRLAEHHGNRYKVIEEALAFVGDVHDTGHFVSAENLFAQPCSPSGENLMANKENGSSVLIKILVSCFNFAKRTLRVDHTGGVVGNAALFAVSMIAMMHLHQVAHKEHSPKKGDNIYSEGSMRKTALLEGSLSNICSENLDVLLARG